MSKVGVVIPYYRDKVALDKCIGALKKSTYEGQIEIYIRDNSIDNIYWTKAVNEGVRRLRKDCGAIFILNQDAFVLPDTLGQLSNVLNSSKKIGIACPIQIRPNSKKVYWGGSLEAFPFGRHLAMPVEQYTTDFNTYWANGAAMLIKTTLIDEIGLFDENMKFICSDSDYSFTARSRGFEIRVVYEALVEHGSGQSGHSTNKTLNQIKLEDAIYFSRKWLTNENYIRLSFEGKFLDNNIIEREINTLENQLQKLKN